MKDNNLSKIVVILGTNASGKSSLGIELAKKYNGEIISADSRQIFKGFDLCCGKVSSDEMAIVPHHMINICDIGTKFSVYDYQKKAYSLIYEIIERGHTPFIVGGTGLYISSIVDGYEFCEEEIDYSFRDYLESKSVDELKRLLINDNNCFKMNRSDYNNKRRLVRAIEKVRLGHSLVNDCKPQFSSLQLGITWPQEILYRRIDERLQDRINQGMIEEVVDYLDNGGDVENLYALGLEYRYIAWYVKGKYNSKNEFQSQLSQAIKHFSKRQMKWFKKDSSIVWIDMEDDYLTETCELINTFLEL